MSISENAVKPQTLEDEEVHAKGGERSTPKFFCWWTEQPGWDCENLFYGDIPIESLVIERRADGSYNMKLKADTTVNGLLRELYIRNRHEGRQLTSDDVMVVP